VRADEGFVVLGDARVVDAGVQRGVGRGVAQRAGAEGEVRALQVVRVLLELEVAALGERGAA
jgi:hypothetical protein